MREPQQSRSQNTLHRILSSGTALIAEQSYDAVTIADIARRAKISVGGFYARFKNKEALFKVLQEQFAQETQMLISQALEKDWTERSLSDLLQLMVSSNAELYEKYRGVLVVVHLKTRTLATPEDSASLRDYNRKLIAQLESLILLKRDEIQHRQAGVAVRTAIA